MSESEVDKIDEERRAYVVLLRSQIRQLHGILKMRLRVEFPESLQVLNQLNERLLSIGEIGSDIENLYSDLLERSKIYQDSISKAQKYEAMAIKIREIEEQFKQRSEETLFKNENLERDNQQIQIRIQQIQQELLKRDEEMSSLRSKCEILENESKARISDINRITMERDNAKKQSQNLNSLLKQVNEEKQVKTQKIQSLTDQKVTELQEELHNIIDNHQQQLLDKDNMIQKLERELQFTKKELELNSEFAFLQSSISSSSHPFRQKESYQNNEKPSYSKTTQKEQKESNLKSSEIQRQPVFQHDNYDAHQDIKQDESLSNEQDNDESDSSEGDSLHNENLNQVVEQDANSSKHVPNKQQQKKNTSESSNSSSGKQGIVDSDEDDLSENDSIDEEVNRRLELKQNHTKNPVRSSSIPEIRGGNNNYVESSRNRSSSFASQQILINKGKNEKKEEDQDSEESLEMNAERIRAIQRKKNQEKFEQNKRKLISQKNNNSSSDSNEEEEEQ